MHFYARVPAHVHTHVFSYILEPSQETLAKGRAKCNPIGFKIGLEIMARCRCKNVVDVPITFQDRVAGTPFFIFVPLATGTFER